MRRSGYSDSCDGWALIRWRGAVESAISGRRGQAFLRDLVTALDALPASRLIAGDLEHSGEYCAIGSVGRLRGVDMSGIDAYDRDKLAEVFGIAPAMAAELMHVNDEWWHASPEERFATVRAWALRNLSATTLIGEPEPKEIP